MMKRKRSTNFSWVEKELLLELALKKQKILENKTSNAVTWKDKEKAWEDISLEYNSQTTGTPRNGNCLKLKYENLKKNMRGSKATLFATGGGPSQKSFEPSSDLEAQLFRVIQVSVEGIPCENDSDTIVVDNANELIDKPSDSTLQEVQEVDEDEYCTDFSFIYANSDEPFLFNAESSSNIESNDVSKMTTLASTSKLTQMNTESTLTWTPGDAVKLLKNNGKNTKLEPYKTNTESKLKKQKMCHASASQKIVELTEEKKNLVELQEELVKLEIEQSKELHKLKMEHMIEEHKLKMLALQLECEQKQKQMQLLS